MITKQTNNKNLHLLTYEELIAISEVYWREEDKQKMAYVQSMQELAVIGMEKLYRMEKEHPDALILQCCGPLTNGGKGSFDANKRELTKAIALHILQDDVVFNQLPFGKGMMRILNDVLKIPSSEKKERNRIILEEFYDPIFKSGRLHKLVFVPLWETSEGAIFEKERGVMYNINVDYLPCNWSPWE